MLKYTERTHDLKVDVMNNPNMYPEIHRVLMAQNKFKFESNNNR